MAEIVQALGLARSMTYKDVKPSVRKVIKLYRAGISVATKAMGEIEERLERKAGLETWFIKITPPPQMG